MKKKSLKEKMREKWIIRQTRQKIKEIAYLMPDKDRKKFEKACETQEKLCLEIMKAGIPRDTLEQLFVSVAKQKALIQKHKKKLKFKAQ